MLSQAPPNSVDEEGKSMFDRDFEAIQNILQQAISQERNNEIQFIQNKLRMLENNFNPAYIEKDADLATIKSLLITLEEGDGINYNKLISLINIVEQGVTNTKSVFEFEYNHLVKLDEARKKNQKALESQISGLGRS